MILENPVKFTSPEKVTQQYIQVNQWDAKRYGCGRTLRRDVTVRGTIEKVSPADYRYINGKIPPTQRKRVKYGFIKFKHTQALVVGGNDGWWQLHEVKPDEAS